jgi:hypothetical protein
MRSIPVDRPARLASPKEATKIEITSKMIQAGHDAYAGFFLALMNGDDVADAMVKEVFQAMSAEEP